MFFVKEVIGMANIEKENDPRTIEMYRRAFATNWSPHSGIPAEVWLSIQEGTSIPGIDYTNPDATVVVYSHGTITEGKRKDVL